jgi:hypothetical protein
MEQGARTAVAGPPVTERGNNANATNVINQRSAGSGVAKRKQHK